MDTGFVLAGDKWTLIKSVIPLSPDSSRQDYGSADRKIPHLHTHARTGGISLAEVTTPDW